MSWNEREDDFSSVAFWYQTGESTFAARAPDAKARKLPSLERVSVAAKDFADPHFHGVGGAEKQYLDIHDSEQMLYMPKSADGAYVEIPFRVDKKEPLRLLLSCTASYDFGRYQAYLVPPGALQKVKLQGAFDLYSQDIKQVEVHLLDFWPEPGYYKLRLECVGKNPKSEGYYLGLESVRLRERRPRVTQMGWDKGKDWTKNPTLYN